MDLLCRFRSYYCAFQHHNLYDYNRFKLPRRKKLIHRAESNPVIFQISIHVTNSPPDTFLFHVILQSERLECLVLHDISREFYDVSEIAHIHAESVKILEKGLAKVA